MAERQEVAWPSPATAQKFHVASGLGGTAESEGEREGRGSRRRTEQAGPASQIVGVALPAPPKRQPIALGFTKLVSPSRFLRFRQWGEGA